MGFTHGHRWWVRGFGCSFCGPGLEVFGGDPPLRASDMQSKIAEVMKACASILGIATLRLGHTEPAPTLLA